MFYEKNYFFVFISFFSLTVSKCFAQIYLSIDGIAGGVNSKGLKGVIELSSVQMEASNSARVGTNGGLSAGKVSLSEIAMTMNRGNASPAIQLYVFNGKQIPKAEIKFFKQGSSTPYLTVTLENVIISNWSLSSGGDNPSESFSIAFAKIKTEDAVTNPDGSIKMNKVSWDVIRNTAN